MSFVRKILILLNTVAATLLALSSISSIINPVKAWPLAFIGLIFFLLVLINLIFFLFWIIVRRKYVWISIITLLLSFPVLRKIIAFHPGSNEGSGGEREFSIMSYNVRNFDLYNWTHEKGMLDEIITLIRETQPDMICFQEFYNAERKFSNNQTPQQRIGLSFL